MTATNPLDGRSYMIGFAVLAVAGASAFKGLMFLGRPEWALIAIAGLLAVALSITFALRGRLDETGRAAEQFAWYWGAGGAMAIFLALTGVYMALGAPMLGLVLRGPWSPVELMALGAFALAAAELVGFALAGVAWWMAKR
jgi:hypothetical protein